MGIYSIITVLIVLGEVATAGEGKLDLLTSSFGSYLTISVYETHFYLPLSVKGVVFAKRILIDSSCYAAAFD
ncbi:hypothetical protein RIR_e71097_A0A2N0RDA1_9GLOM [Rhizophagus irregularis DAOM 181602=DAOM 197198]|nr:hypothetical protein RIR_e71097_A0A2N0RDA1_9GLOM [Rhizophagus irregularis DAOM 181602=DAOM 197198]